MMKSLLFKSVFVLYLVGMAVSSLVVAWQTVNLQAALSTPQGTGESLNERVRATEVNVQALVSGQFDRRLTVVETQLSSLMKLLWLVLAGVVGKTVQDHFNMHRVRNTLRSSNDILMKLTTTTNRTQAEHSELLRMLEASRKEHEDVMRAAKSAGLGSD